MELDTVFDLPAHPLLVHLPVVVVPAAAGLVALAIVLGRARTALAAAALALAVAGTVGTYLVQESGEPLEDRVEDARGETDALDEHTDAGETVLPFVGAFTGVAAVGAGIAATGRRRLAVPVLALALVAGGLSVWRLTVVGHSGARAAWDDVVGGAEGDEGDDDGDSGRGRGRGRGGEG